METQVLFTESGKILITSTEDGIKSVKEILPNDLINCITNSALFKLKLHSGQLPTHTLYYSANCETHSYNVIIEHSAGYADIQYMNTVYPDFPLPCLVFGFTVESSNRLSNVTLAVTEQGKLSEKSRLFHYPFSNVSERDFSVCTGGNSLPEIKQPYSLTNMPDYILSLPDNDDHFNSSHNKLNLGHRELMEHLRDKPPEYYYTDVLIPSGKTLKDFYEECAL